MGPDVDACRQAWLPLGLLQSVFGAVRSIGRDALVIYVEGAGDFVVPRAAIRSARYGKVMLDPDQLDDRFLTAAGAAHENESE